MSDWQPIETAPKDGRLVWVKRVYNGEDVTEGWAEWGISAQDAPIRQWSGDLPPDTEMANTERWLKPGRLHAFPTPTHWKLTPPPQP